MQRLVPSCVLAFSFAVASCGGASSSAPSAQSPGASGSGESAKLASLHHDFLSSCKQGTNGFDDYCECAWGEMKKSFTEEEMSSDHPDPQKLEQFKAQTKSACGGKIPEEAVRASFDQGCAGDRPAMREYCACSWKEYRKQFSAAELADNHMTQDPRFLQARPVVLKACGGKIPESVTREDFMKGCAKEPRMHDFCSCAWTQLRKLASPAQIETGDFDEQKFKESARNACSKVHPQ